MARGRWDLTAAVVAAIVNTHLEEDAIPIEPDQLNPCRVTAKITEANNVIPYSPTIMEALQARQDAEKP